jgi:amino acid permease
MGTVTASIGVLFSVLTTYQHKLPYFEAYSSAEMSAFKPAGGGFVRHATMWLDKSTGIAIGHVHSIPI